MNAILPRLFETYFPALRRIGTAADRKPKWNATVPPNRSERKDCAPAPRSQA
jgi:hypothetical protein